jgi:hypothetical protein
MKKLLAMILLLAGASTTLAQQGPRIPSSLELATVPGLSSEQQLGLRKIFQQRRDAEEALFSKQHAEFEVLRVKGRSEHERIDDSTDASLRKLLGDEGYRKFAEWQVGERAGPRGSALPPRHGPGNAPGGAGGPRLGPGSPEARPNPQGAPAREGDE